MAENGSPPEQEHALPRPVKTEYLVPMFYGGVEETPHGALSIRFILNPMEHIVIEIPKQVGAVMRENLQEVGTGIAPATLADIPRG